MTASRNELVTPGASTGIGASTAHELAVLGHHVLAGARDDREADDLRCDGVEPVGLDITQPPHIAALVERVAADLVGGDVADDRAGWARRTWLVGVAGCANASRSSSTLTNGVRLTLARASLPPADLTNGTSHSEPKLPR